jgi:hypothetical protein
MKIISSNSNFEPCPEYTGRAVCVDSRPLKKQQSQYGERDVFRFVFETLIEREDGSRFRAWSRNFTPSLNEKASLRKFVRRWLGRDLTKAEMDDFDTESLIGKTAQIVVVHEHKEEETYANIVACTPDKSAKLAEAEANHRRYFIDQAALDPLTGRVVAIGLVVNAEGGTRNSASHRSRRRGRHHPGVLGGDTR